MLGPLVLGHATDVIIDGIRGGTGIDYGRLHEILLEGVALYVASAVLSVGRHRSSPASSSG